MWHLLWILQQEKNVATQTNHCHSREARSVSKIAVSASNLSVPTDDTRLGQEFIKSIVHRFHDDEIGNICRQDEMILLLG